MFMKSAAVHKFMRKKFMPFLYEHGLERPMAPAIGVACTNHAGFHIRMGYELGVGFYDWTGNTIQLIGGVSKLGLVKRALQANSVQPDDLLPAHLRSELRSAALQKLIMIARSAQAKNSNAPNFLQSAGHILGPLRRSETDALYVPDFRYQNETDLAAWCAIVRPFIPACIAALKTEAEQLRDDS
jgi:hypothetical protein